MPSALPSDSKTVRRRGKRSRRADWFWRGWGLRYYRPRGWYVLRMPIGSIGIDHHRAVTPDWFSRGRRREIHLRIPLSRKWQVHISSPGKDYLTLVGGPKELRNLDWIIDEFDHNFNDLAVASLRYHLGWSVCDNEARREQYEDLITRLSEPEPETTDAEAAAIATWEPLTELNHESGRHTVTECPPAAHEAFESWRAREDAHRKRVDQARHDFVDVMRALWS